MVRISPLNLQINTQFSKRCNTKPERVVNSFPFNHESIIHGESIILANTVFKLICIFNFTLFKTHSHHSVVSLGKTLYALSPAWWSWRAVLNYSHISIKLQADSNILEAGRGNCLPYVLAPPSLYRESGG